MSEIKKRRLLIRGADGRLYPQLPERDHVCSKEISEIKKRLQLKDWRERLLYCDDAFEQWSRQQYPNRLIVRANVYQSVHARQEVVLAPGLEDDSRRPIYMRGARDIVASKINARGGVWRCSRYAETVVENHLRRSNFCAFNFKQWRVMYDLISDHMRRRNIEYFVDLLPFVHADECTVYLNGKRRFLEPWQKAKLDRRYGRKKHRVWPQIAIPHPYDGMTSDQIEQYESNKTRQAVQSLKHILKLPKDQQAERAAVMLSNRN